MRTINLTDEDFYKVISILEDLERELTYRHRSPKIISDLKQRIVKSDMRTQWQNGGLKEEEINDLFKLFEVCK